MLRTADLDYDLPPGRIATRPAEPRERARLMVVTDDGVEHATIADLASHLRAGDALVLNATTVIPAWLAGRRVGTGGRWTGLYLGPADDRRPDDPRWRVMFKGGHLHPGVELGIDLPMGEGEAPAPSGVVLSLVERAADEPGAWVVDVRGASEGEGAIGLLGRIGAAPIPPYIRKARDVGGERVAGEEDLARYQTVYADRATLWSGHGSVAAPTAGMHLTHDLLDGLRARGVGVHRVALHVGTGTFRPVEAERVEEHPMHAEWCSVDALAPGTLEDLDRVREGGGRVVCVGTTAARVLEAFGQRREQGLSTSGWIETRILITPGYRFRLVDGLLTNFHLPRSTLLAMAAAITPGGLARLKALYADAMARGYRFYSYGDAMLIWRTGTRDGGVVS